MKQFACGVALLLVAGNALADRPLEAVELNPLFPMTQRGALGNPLVERIVKAAELSQYLSFKVQGDELAYTLTPVDARAVHYDGNPGDLQGKALFNLTAYRDGKKVNTQLTTYRTSFYSNAIHLVKIGRDKYRPYQFDLGIDSQGRLFTVRSRFNVTYFSPSLRAGSMVSAK